jgi:hypothetical protein
MQRQPAAIPVGLFAGNDSIQVKDNEAFPFMHTIRL